MKRSTANFNFKAKPWQHAGPGGWYFVSMLEEMAEKIRKNFKGDEEGWGRLKAIARIGNTEWATAIWFDTNRKTYLLPLKAAIRKKEQIGPASLLEIQVTV